MCGICGIAGKPITDSGVEAVGRMVESLKHRGPDASNIKVLKNSIFGHTRLSIVDIESGQQPMVSSDGKIVISFNGEIYGYQSIRKNLEKHSIKFLTNSDTEVVLELYKMYGTSMLAHLPGAFSFAIWDEKKQRLFCARDRAGEKPFYYTLIDNTLIFASEMKAILASSMFNPRISEISLIHFLNRGYVNPRYSIFNNVKILPPASYLIYQDGDLKVKKYWQLPDDKLDISLSEAVEGFSEKLTTAVKNQLIADVSVSFFLSGGLDSSTLVSIGASLEGQVNTIAFGYTGAESELPYAREVSKLYGTNAVEIAESSMNPFEAMKTLSKVYDEPFWDSSAMATYQICAAARHNGKVVISGDGADELLGGYVWWYNSLVLLEEFSGYSQLKKTRQLFGDFSKLLLKKSTFGLLNFDSSQQRNGLFFRNILTKRSPKEIRERGKWPMSKSQLTEMGFEKRTIDAAYPEFLNFSGTVNDSLKNEFLDYLPGNMLVKLDRAAMANGLETRMPFLDSDLVSFVSSLPSKYKITSKADKILLRGAFEKNWPISVRARKKQGFGVDSNRWSGMEDYSKYMNEYVNNSRSKIYSYMDFEGTKNLLEKNSGKEYAILMLAMWAENYAP